MRVFAAGGFVRTENKAGGKTAGATCHLIGSRTE
jgi:hypothetical protein